MKKVKKSDVRAWRQFLLLQELNSPPRMKEQDVKKYLERVLIFYSDKAVTKKELFGLAKEICEYVYDDAVGRIASAGTGKGKNLPENAEML
jgi:hypothetical protein